MESEAGIIGDPRLPIATARLGAGPFTQPGLSRFPRLQIPPTRGCWGVGEEIAEPVSGG